MLATTIDLDVAIPVPVARAWALVTQPEHIAAWFGDGQPGRLDLRPGGRATFSHGPHGPIPARVQAVEPGRRLAFRWVVIDPYDAEPGPVNSTLVDFRLAPDGDGTRLHVTEQGFDQLDLPDTARQARYQANADGWPRILARLREHAAA